MHQSVYIWRLSQLQHQQEINLFNECDMETSPYTHTSTNIDINENRNCWAPLLAWLPPRKLFYLSLLLTPNWIFICATAKMVAKVLLNNGWEKCKSTWNINLNIEYRAWAPAWLPIYERKHFLTEHPNSPTLQLIIYSVRSMQLDAFSFDFEIVHIGNNSVAFTYPTNYQFHTLNLNFNA